MTEPVFSIVIPTFNRSQFVSLAIQSVLNQTFVDFEIVVSDNCSTDRTRETVERFADSRVTYVRPTEHLLTVDNFEFARRQAKGQLILMLGDDDALIATALERFYDEFERTGADFMFSRQGEYKDPSYLGTGRNVLSWPSFTGESRVVSREKYLEELFSFRIGFETHPTSYVFARSLAESIAARCGRFFYTNGVEFFAWPLAAAFARKIVQIDMPLAILGRTGSSLGANLVLCNPGQEQIDSFTPEWNRRSQSAPLSSLIFVNFMADGMLTAKKMFPEELQGHEFDEESYLRGAMSSIRKREVLGVDMSKETRELEKYLEKFPALKAELCRQEVSIGSGDADGLHLEWARRLRSVVASMGGRRLRRELRRYVLARKIRRGEVQSGFQVAGDEFGFSNILGSAGLLTRAVSSTAENLSTRADPPEGTVVAEALR